MTRFCTLIAAFCLAALSACGPTTPTAGVAFGSDGPTAGVGVQSGRVTAGVTTDGNVGVAADVVQTDNMAVSVGTGGVGVTVGSGPVRMGFGTGGWGLRI